MEKITKKKYRMKLKEACQEIIKENKDILTIMLSGSRARGDHTNNSDFDFMFITKRGKDKNITLKYEKKIAKKTNISCSLIQVKLWTNKFFKKRYEKGDSFVYCALRDGKILASRQINFEKELPDCKQAAKERLDISKKNLDFIKWLLKDCKQEKFYGLSLEHLGYCSMHLCWAVCMFDNFCPLSKYTVLKESKKYFSQEEFKIIQENYKFYSHPVIEKELDKKTVEKFYNGLNGIMKRVGK